MSPWLIVGAVGLALAPLLSISHTGPGPIALVRDLWLLALLAVAVAWTLQHEVIFAPMAVWFLWRWRAHELLPSLVTWVGIAATWEVARALPPQVIHLLPWPWVGIACALSGVIIAQRWWGKDERVRAEPCGWLGQRTLASAWLALILPFAPWWARPVLGTGFWLTGPSWIAAAALVAGLGVLWPWAWLLGGAGGALGSVLWRFTRLIEYTPRGNTIDGLWTRLRKYRLIVAHLTLAGHGPHTLPKQNMRWASQYSTPECREPVALGEGHQEVLQQIWDYGAFGALSVVLLIWDVAPRLRLHDPWSASAVIAAVICQGMFPLRVVPLGVTILVIWASVNR